MASFDELRAVPDRYFNGYAWPLGAWAIGLLFLFALQRTPFALWLCYPLTVWYGALTAAWAYQTRQRRVARELTAQESLAGVSSVGRFLAGASLAPAVVFMAVDPLSPTTWGTCGGVIAVAFAAWLGANLLPRLRRRPATIVALLGAWAALPINATGAVSLAAAWGLFENLPGR